MRILMPLVLTLAIVFGCASEKVIYHEASNFSFLDLGSYHIGVDNKFEFVGDINSAGQVETIDNLTLSRVKYKIYIFADNSQSKENIKRIIAVSIYDTKGTAYWRGEANFDNYESNENMQVLHKGRTKLGESSVACAVLSLKSIQPKIMELLENKYYKRASDINNGIDVKIGKTIGRYRLVHIDYFKSGDGNHPDVFEYINSAKQLITFEKR